MPKKDTTFWILYYLILLVFVITGFGRLIHQLPEDMVITKTLIAIDGLILLIISYIGRILTNRFWRKLKYLDPALYEWLQPPEWWRKYVYSFGYPPPRKFIFKREYMNVKDKSFIKICDAVFNYYIGAYIWSFVNAAVLFVLLMAGKL